jgi:hypothetical protein
LLNRPANRHEVAQTTAGGSNNNIAEDLAFGRVLQKGSQRTEEQGMQLLTKYPMTMPMTSLLIHPISAISSPE